jgi:hypothetical protein
VVLARNEFFTELSLCNSARARQFVSMVPDEEPKSASASSPPSPVKGRRRSRRGGRRHSRRRGPRPPEQSSSDATSSRDATETIEPAPIETEPGHPAESRSIPEGSAVSGAIDQVMRVIDELKHALNEMEEVLETLELAERQKIEDEREIESLQRALRQLHRPSSGGPSRR